MRRPVHGQEERFQRGEVGNTELPVQQLFVQEMSKTRSEEGLYILTCMAVSKDPAAT